MSVNKNYPAFPNKLQRGMTLRDYFAAEAMLAQVGNPLKLDNDEAQRLIAEQAYRMADVMLAERDKGGAP